MSENIHKFLATHRAADGTHHTHVSMVNPKGRFSLSHIQLENFWELYCDAIFAGFDNIVLGIAEKPNHFIPILADIDIKLIEDDKSNFGEKLYTEEHVIRVIEAYQSAIRLTIDDITDLDLTCVLLEKPLYRTHKNKTTFVKNGFHLHFPYIFLNKIEQDIHIIPRVKHALKELRIFSDIGIDDSSIVVDKSSLNVPWLLYGSRKDGDEMSSYKLSKIYDHNLKLIDLEKAFTNYKLYDYREKLINISTNVEYYLPRILSVLQANRHTFRIKKDTVSLLKQNQRSIEAEINNEDEVDKTVRYKAMSIADKLKVSEKLLPLLSLKRAQDRNEWITVGWILFNIGEGSNEAFQQWCQFSARDTATYDEDVCLFQWERMTRRNLTLGTLKYMVSLDSPEEYKKYKNEVAVHHFKQAVQGSHNDIAKVLFCRYGDQFVCSSIATKTWYQFTNPCWEEIEEGTFLRERMSDELANEYRDFGKDVWFEANSFDNQKTESNAKKEEVKYVERLICNLRSAPFKNNVMRECMEVFYDKSFKSKLDANPYLIGFKNGVYDLEKNAFRDGRPEDFLSRCMPIEYKDFTETDDKVIAVYDFLEKVFPDTSVRKYFMDHASDVFVGGNSQKVVLFWTGDGDNGKSVTQSIFEKMLGPYAVKFSTTLITGKKTQTGSANPELARAGNGVRWAVLEEPDGDEQINIGMLKSLSGNDSYWARDLFEKGKSTREILPMFKLIFICNKPPKFNYADRATWNRIRVIPFEATFVRPGEECPETYEEQLQQKRFPMDTEFSKKIPDLLEAFAWVLLRHRQNITSRFEPEKVILATDSYKRQNDIYRQFIDECLRKDANSSLSLMEMYYSFKEWFKESCPNTTIPIKNEFRDYFTKHWGQPEEGIRWNGYRFRSMNESSSKQPVSSSSAVPDLLS